MMMQGNGNMAWTQSQPRPQQVNPVRSAMNPSPAAEAGFTQGMNSVMGALSPMANANQQGPAGANGLSPAQRMAAMFGIGMPVASPVPAAMSGGGSPPFTPQGY